MDGARLSRYPHHSWLGNWTTVGDDNSLITMDLHQVAHCLTFAGRHRAEVRWIQRGGERFFTANEGTVRFAPADDDHHLLVGRCERGHQFYNLIIPPRHIESVAEEEGIATGSTLRYLLLPDDAVLQSCLNRIGMAPIDGRASYLGATDEVARTLILRLAELSGGGKPDWNDDGSAFARRTLDDLVEYIDTHVKVAPSLSDMAMRLGLSPSHFARKFRQSTGLSLHRFINRRRIRASLEVLKDESRPLAHVAMELGFSSQSHLTRLFSGLTGMTPAKYRRQHRQARG